MLFQSAAQIHELSYINIICEVMLRCNVESERKLEGSQVNKGTLVSFSIMLNCAD